LRETTVEGERVQRRLAAILTADVAGYSRLTGADEEGTIARLRALRRELIDPTVASHGGRIVKTTGDGILIEFASVVDAARCAVEVQLGMTTRNTDMPADKRIEFRVGIHLGDVVVEGDDLLGDGVNVAARLEGVAEPGSVCISEDAYRQVKGKVALPVLDLGEHRLKNIADPIHLYTVSADALAGQVTVASAFASHGAPRLSIVVLPFANLGGDKGQEFFVDALTEMLTNDLCRIESAFVIGRNTAFTYKDKAADARQIGRELGVRYVVEGSVQTGADRLRVSAQLIDAETGAQLWAERFDEPRADFFNMQDEITTRLARALRIRLIAAEARRSHRERPNSMDALDLYMRGKAVWHRVRSAESAREARRLFEAALRLDDDYVDALIGVADAHMFEVANMASDDPKEQIRLAAAAVSKALAVAPRSAKVHLYRAGVCYLQGDPEQALRECDLAISLNRNDASAHAFIGRLKILVGRAEETEAHVAEALRLSPRDPQVGIWLRAVGTADLVLGRLDRAIDWLRRSVAIDPNNAISCAHLAAALASAGHEAEAAETWSAARHLVPAFTISKFCGIAASANPMYLRQRQLLCEGMRKAGVPEE
jgi:class 3 adenylate cyclase/TolB-like protein/predicted Zn-dependent protease